MLLERFPLKNRMAMAVVMEADQTTEVCLAGLVCLPEVVALGTAPEVGAVLPEVAASATVLAPVHGEPEAAMAKASVAFPMHGAPAEVATASVANPRGWELVALGEAVATMMEELVVVSLAV